MMVGVVATTELQTLLARCARVLAHDVIGSAHLRHAGAADGQAHAAADVRRVKRRLCVLVARLLSASLRPNVAFVDEGAF